MTGKRKKKESSTTAWLPRFSKAVVSYSYFYQLHTLLRVSYKVLYTSTMPPQRRYARSALEKWEICQARQQAGKRSGEMMLEDFCKLFPNPDGKLIPMSSMSMILRKTDITTPPSGASALRMKERRELFPIFERVLAEWIEKAIVAKVLVSDEIIKEQGRILIQELGQRVVMAHIQHFEENYTGFELSNGWLGRFKTRNSLAKQKYAGNSGSTDPALVAPARESLQHALKNTTPGNIYNIDETAFQLVYKNLLGRL